MGTVSPSRMELMQQKMQQMSQLITCPRCGSRHFVEHTYNKYNASTYGSTPGADMMVVSTMPQTIRVCLCGWPYNPNISGVAGRGTVRANETEGFNTSLASAQKYLTGISETNLDKVTQEMATIGEVEELKQQVADLKEQVLQLLAQVAEAEAEAPAPEAPANG